MNLFSILAISEHCLHEEQLDFFKTVTGDSYNYTAVSGVPMIIRLCFQGNLHTGELLYSGNVPLTTSFLL